MRARDVNSGSRRPACPIKVVLAERDAPPAITPERAQGATYRGAWIYVLEGGRPVGKIEVGLDDGPLRASEVALLIRDRLPGPRISLPVPPSQDVRLPFATVVVATAGERPDDLLRCLERLSEVAYPDYEILVVDNRPDRPRKLFLDRSIASMPRARVLEEHTRGVSAARNRGIAEARGEVVAFTDDDIIVDRRWLEKLVRPIATDRSVSAVTGLVLPRELETVAQCWFEEYAGGFGHGFEPLRFRPISGPGIVNTVECVDSNGTALEVLSLFSASVRCGNAGSMAIRSNLLRDMGGFDICLGTGRWSGGGEDLALCAKLLSSGLDICYEPAAFSFHSHRQRYEDLTRQMHAWGKGLTAMLTALTWEDPRQVPALAVRALPALKRVIHRSRIDDQAASRNRATFPRRLRWYEISGMLTGPPAYLLDRLQNRFRDQRGLP